MSISTISSPWRLLNKFKQLSVLDLLSNNVEFCGGTEKRVLDCKKIILWENALKCTEQENGIKFLYEQVYINISICINAWDFDYNKNSSEFILIYLQAWTDVEKAVDWDGWIIWSLILREANSQQMKLISWLGYTSF